MSIYTTDLQTLYVAYFNRPADPAGLAFWENALATGRATLNDVRAAFATDVEYKTAYAGKTPTQIVTQVYLNLFGDLPDPAGLSFWVQRMLAGDVTIDTVVAEIAKGAQNEDRIAIQSKSAAAVAFTEALNTVEEINAYESDAGQAIGKAFVSGVKDAATLATATTAANLNKVTTDVVIVADPNAAAVLSAKASYETAAAATTAAIADATTKAAAATTAAAAITAAQTAATAAQTKADATDAAALAAAAVTAKATADAAVTAKATADAAVVTAQANYDAALASGDALAVSTANGNLLIAQARATTAAATVTSTAAAAATAQAAATAAAADDAAAVTAAGAVTTAVTAATGAADAAVAAGAAATAAAAAAATAANGYVTAANATAANADNAAAAAAVAAAAAASTSAAAVAANANAANAIVQAVLVDAQGQIEVAAAVTAYNAAVAASATAAAAATAAATAADAAIAGADSLEKANAAIAAANAEATAAAAQKTAADAVAAAAAAYAAAAAKTASGADNTAAAAAVIAADAAVAAANGAVAAAQADVTQAAALPANFVAKTIALTKGVDTEAGGAGADVFNGSFNGAESTLTKLDILNGGAGVDTLNIVDLDGSSEIDSSITLNSVEVINVRSAGEAKINTTGANMTGVTNVNVTQSADANVTVGATTAASVSGSTGAVTIIGGASQSVNAILQAGKIDLSGSAGAVSVTSASQGAQAIEIDGGSTVTVNATSSATGTTGTINVGQTTAATGAVVVNANLKSDGTVANVTGGAINVKGGSSITVNANLASAAKDNDADFDGTIGAITAVGDGKTTSVVINQTKSATTVTKASVAQVRETSVVTFSAMKANETLTINGLTFTANKDLTAEQVASAFANLTRNDTQSQTGPVANGVYSDSFNAAAWTSGAASGATVTFTANDFDEANLTFTGTAATNDAAARIPTQVPTAGTPSVGSDKSGNTTAYGAVRVDDDAAAAITTVTVNGYASADLGNTGADLNKLATLSLANSAGAATVRSSSTTVGLTVNNVKHAVDMGAAVTTLNLTNAGVNSTFALTAGGVKDLTVAGDKSANLSGSTLTALETVTVTGSAGVNLGASAVAKSVTTTGTTGTVTATLGTTATYTGGAGVDNVTLTATSITKDVVLGAGNDSLTLANATTDSSVVLNGGDGTDTLVLRSVDAATLSGAAVFETKFTGFERVQLNLASDGARVVDMSNMNDVNYVIAAGAAAVTPVAQVTEVTVAGSTDDALDTVSIMVGGVTYTATGAFADATAAAAALATQIDGAAAYTASAAAGKITITAAVAGTAFTVGAASATSNGGAADTVSSTSNTTTANVTGSAASSALTLNKFVNGGTVELSGGATSTTVSLADATGSADILNIVTNVESANVSFGTVAAAGVETININAMDIVLDDNGDGANDAVETASLTLSDAALNSVIVTGNSNVNLTLNANVVALTSVNASALTGSLTASTNGTVAQTIMGGSGSDVLTAIGSKADRLEGGAGSDSLFANAGLTTLVGGAGADTFNITVASTNVNSAATIADLSSGDIIDFAGATSFSSAAVALDAGTAVFQDYANAAINSIGSNGLAWFVFGGNTYIVMDAGANGTAFVNGEDMIVKITGAMDLSNGSFNTTFGTFEMV